MEYRKFWINLQSEKRGSQCLEYEALAHLHELEPPLSRGHEYIGKFLADNKKLEVIDMAAYKELEKELDRTTECLIAEQKMREDSES